MPWPLWRLGEGQQRHLQGKMPTKGCALRTRGSGQKCANPRDFRDQLMGGSRLLIS